MKKIKNAIGPMVKRRRKLATRSSCDVMVIATPLVELTTGSIELLISCPCTLSKGRISGRPIRAVNGQMHGHRLHMPL